MNYKELDQLLESLNDTEQKSLVSLSEAYIGKSETLLEAEKQLNIIRKELTPYHAASNTKAILKFNRLIEKQFGMELFGLHILTSTEPDAYTMTIGLRIENIDEDMKKYVIGDSKFGYKFAKDNGLCIIVNISYGILGDHQYTTEECMAIILHEIGHNFADCMFDSLITYNNEIMKQYRQSVLDTCIYKGTIDYYLNLYSNKEYYKKEKKAQKNKFLSNALAWLSYSKTRVKDFNYLIYVAFARLTANRSALDDYMKNQYPEEEREKIRASENRQSEIIADKFPAIYGYSTNIVSALFKMSDIKNDKYYNMANKLGKVFGGQSNNFKYQEYIMKDMLDTNEHPDNVQRLHVALNTLENEFNKSDIDPAIKKEIKSQIDDIKGQLKEYTDASKKIRNIEKVQAQIYEYINKTCPDATVEGLEDSIEKVLDDKLKEIKKKENNRKKS